MFQRRESGNGRRVRYAVVGLGWIAQDAVLPAFAHAADTSELVALVSDDPTKLKELGDKYKVEHRAEPYEVFAFAAGTHNPRFNEVHETISVTMRFPDDRLASFTTGFGMDTSWFQVVGTKGDLRVDPAFSFSGELKHHLTVDEKTKTTTFRQRDHFTAEITHFSDCVLKNVPVEPSGEEGLVDIRIVEAIHQSILTGQPVRIEGLPQRHYRPSLAQEIHLPPVKEPELVNADSPKAGAN